jgi:hypothetical protein
MAIGVFPRWRGRSSTEQEQVANAWTSFVDLTPASEAPAEAVRAAWLPLQAGQEIPLVGELRYDPVKADDPDEYWSRY